MGKEAMGIVSRVFSKIVNTIKSPALSAIWKWSRGHRRFVLLLSLLNLLLASLTLGMSLATKGLIDGVIDKNHADIRLYGILLGSILAATVAVYVINDRLSVYLSARLEESLRRESIAKLLRKDYVALRDYHSGELVNRMFSDVSKVVSGIVEVIPPLVCGATQVIGAAILLARMDIRFVLFFLALALVTLIVMLFFRKNHKTLHRKMQESEDALHASMQETVENIRLIKASGSEARMERRIEGRQGGFFKARMRRADFTVAMGGGVMLLFRVGWISAMGWGCYGIYRGDFTYGTLTAILQLVGQIQGPISGLSGIAAKLYTAIASAERLLELHGLPNEAQTDEEQLDPVKTYERLESIRFDHVNFSYDRGERVLTDVCTEIKRGDFVAVTGLSGGGKSTLFLLLLGIYRPSAGAVVMATPEGERALGRSSRRLFAYVPQGNILFSGTLRENLTMFCESATEEEIARATEIACIDDFLKTLPKGLDTVIGERGIGLSEGQAQRIAVARALLSGAPILLLDEATSALDEETEAALLRNIANLQNKTCLIVTHRKAALSICRYRLNIEKSELTRIPL